MKKWYSNILKDLRKLGDKIFIQDTYELINDKNLFKELVKKYYIHEYKNDGSLHLFFSKNKDKPIIVLSQRNIQADFIDRNFKKKELLLSDVFPELDQNILSQLDISYYQTLYNYYMERKNKGLMVGSTEDIVLKSVWDIDIGKLHSSTENLKIALSFIVDSKEVPKSIISQVSKKLAKDIIEIKRNKEEFIFWIKEIINKYIFEKKNGTFPSLDLSDSSIQFYLLKIGMKYNIDISISEDMIYKESWLSKFKKEPNKKEIITNIKSSIESYKNKMNELTNKEFDFNEVDDIMKLSRLFCEILFNIQNNDLKLNEFIEIDKEYDNFDKLFRNKLVNNSNNNYEYLSSASQSNKPLTVNKILDYAKNQFHNRIALIVMDGMSYDEWFILKEELKDFNTTENEIFAMIPTVTAFSRTAIFSGKTPNEFMDEKLRFNEEKEFYKAMVAKGFREDNTLYGHLNLKHNYLKTKKGNLEYDHIKEYDFLGVVCNLFDELSHQDIVTNTGKSNFYKNIRNQVKSSTLVSFFKQLKEDGYKIIITADHGNIFCKGNGIKSNKNLEIDRESVRCLIFDNDNFAENIINQHHSTTFSYTNSMLPQGLMLVLPVKNQCFTSEKELKITHGGISPEELIVPLVILE